MKEAPTIFFRLRRVLNKSVRSRIYRFNGLLYLFFMFIRKRNILMGKDSFLLASRRPSWLLCCSRFRSKAATENRENRAVKSNIFAARTCCQCLRKMRFSLCLLALEPSLPEWENVLSFLYKRIWNFPRSLLVRRLWFGLDSKWHRSS